MRDPSSPAQPTHDAPRRRDSIENIESTDSPDIPDIPVLGQGATAPLNNRGLNYGDGFFTTMQVEAGDICWLGYHLDRIVHHAEALALDLPSSTAQLLVSRLAQHARELDSGVMKLLVTRAPQPIRGYGFVETKAGSACEYWLSATATYEFVPLHQLTLPNGVTIGKQRPIRAICLTSQIASLPPTLAGLKTLNRLDSVLAAAELQRAQALMPAAPPAEGLLKDMSGTWVEGTMSNVFYQLDNDPQWLTPPLDRSGVRGVMRSVIIDGFRASERPIIERRLTDEDLPRLTALFFCNAVRGVMPVSELIIDQLRRVSLPPIGFDIS